MEEGSVGGQGPTRAVMDDDDKEGGGGWGRLALYYIIYTIWAIDSSHKSIIHPVIIHGAMVLVYKQLSSYVFTRTTHFGG